MAFEYISSYLRKDDKVNVGEYKEEFNLPSRRYSMSKSGRLKARETKRQYLTSTSIEEEGEDRNEGAKRKISRDEENLHIDDVVEDLNRICAGDR